MGSLISWELPSCAHKVLPPHNSQCGFICSAAHSAPVIRTCVILKMNDCATVMQIASSTIIMRNVFVYRADSLAAAPLLPPLHRASNVVRAASKIAYPCTCPCHRSPTLLPPPAPSLFPRPLTHPSLFFRPLTHPPTIPCLLPPPAPNASSPTAHTAFPQTHTLAVCSV